MITCVIRYDLDPCKIDAFEEYARRWGQAIPQCGADLVGYFAPHEGSATTAYGIYGVESLADLRSLPRQAKSAFARAGELRLLALGPSAMRASIR